MLVGVVEKFGGEVVLAGYEVLAELRRHVSGWSNSALRVFLRHDVGSDARHPSHVNMIDVNHVSSHHCCAIYCSDILACDIDGTVVKEKDEVRCCSKVHIYPTYPPDQ